MAKITSNIYQIDIQPVDHFYRTDGSDTNEFYYEISFYKNGEKIGFPLGKTKEILDLFDVETMDSMISTVCFDAISNQIESSISDVMNGGFYLSFIPVGNDWKIKITLSPYYFVHDECLDLEFEVKQTQLYQFAYTLRLEEAIAMA